MVGELKLNFVQHDFSFNTVILNILGFIMSSFNLECESTGGVMKGHFLLQVGTDQACSRTVFSF